MSEATDRRSVLLVLAFLAHAVALPTWAQTEITDEPWGALRDGTRITRYTMTNASGARASFMPLGAAILSVEAPDRNGTLADVVLGFDTAEEYRDGNSAYFGLTIGRYASRIAGTTITLDGETFQLDAPTGRGGAPAHGASWRSRRVQQPHLGTTRCRDGRGTRPAFHVGQSRRRSGLSG